MVEFKLTISNPKTAKTVQREIKDDDARPFVGKKIGDKINGEVINLTGYEFEVTGGSDYCGFPMRKDVRGTARKKILAVSGVGVKKKAKGIKQRKKVCGNTIHDKIVQINLKVLKEGKEDIFKGKEGEAEEKKEKKEKPKKEEKPDKEKKEAKEEKKEKEVKKEEVKKEKEEPKEEKKAAPEKEKVEEKKEKTEETKKEEAKEEKKEETEEKKE